MRSFIFFSLLTCSLLAALGFMATSMTRRVLSRFRAPESVKTESDVRPNVPLPSMTAGWDNVVANLLSAFDYVDVVALGDTHGRKMDSELHLRLIRNPDFPFRARFIVVEFGNSLYQALLDKYIYGEDIPLTAVQQVWQNTTQAAGEGSPEYSEFISAVREVNRKLPPARRLRVIAGDPPVDWDSVKTKADLAPFLMRRSFPVSLGRVTIPRGEKALVIYGSDHLKRPAFPLWAAAADSKVEDHAEAPLPPTTPAMFKALQVTGPGRVLVVKTIAGLNPFQNTLPSGPLPVLVPLTGLHAAVAPGLGDDADACVYYGDTPEATARVLPQTAANSGLPDEEAARREKILAEQ